MTVSRSRYLRVHALLGTASIAICAATPATAQVLNGSPLIAENAPHSATAPDFAINTAHGGPAGSSEFNHAIQDPSIVVADPGTPTTARDPVDVNGIGQMFVAGAGGGIGVCTGSLINPRAVIFAAHCVNTIPQDNYGTANGGTPIAFGFKANNLPGLREWFLPTLNGAPNAEQFRTSVENLVFNVEQVRYHQDSLKNAGALGFLEADVAIAVLDTPALDIPTWALLFSALPAPAAISETTGTGYHVKISGYGRTGTPQLGAINAVDWRRRVAENYLGLLGSLDDRNEFLFGAPSGLPQNLYHLDFDDPLRQDPFDFNLFKDDALPNEGTTAGGDSGGPLILDRTYAEEVIIGVLSGGSRFFGPQPFSAYGTSSFYQPLYLFWDWVAENNPYRYVGAKAGDGNWEDANHWVTLQDPAYRILDADGILQVGTPGTPGLGLDGDDPNKFGQVCFFNECYDLATQQVIVDGEPVENGSVSAAVAASGAGGAASAAGFRAEEAPHGATLAGLDVEDVAHDTAAMLPAATIANGIPGASGFVPGNTDFDRAAGINARYFDVTLSATGTTTLSSAVEIDKLTINGAGAGLTIASGGRLSVVQDVQQLRGTMNVNGTLTTPGDVLMLSGLLGGTGRIVTPFFTSVAGTISPGGAGTIGTLTFEGNAIFASGTNFLIDLGANGASDRVSIVAGSGQPGEASIGGTLGFAAAGGYRLRDGDTYTILTAAGGIDGTFNPALQSFSAILSPELLYGANDVRVRIRAGLYADVVDRSSPIQLAYAGLLDRNRPNSAALSGLYLELDLQNQATIRSQLEALAPRTAPLQSQIGTVMMDSFSRFFRDRMNTVADGSQGGTLAMYGKPMAIASAATVMPGVAGAVTSDMAAGATVQEGRLPDHVAVYLAGGYIDGRGQGLPFAQPGGRNDFDGFFVAAGVEHVMDAATIGFALGYSDVKGQTPVATQTADGRLIQGTLYGTTRFGALHLDAQVSAGQYRNETSRDATIGAANFTLRGDDNAFSFSSEAGVGIVAGSETLAFKPRASVRFAHLGFSNVAETGGGPALRYNLGDFNSIQGRAGATVTAQAGTIRPYLAANYVHEFHDAPGAFAANFVNGIGAPAIFALPGTDRDWGEVSGGVTVGGERFSLTVAGDTTIWRDDLRNWTARGTVAVRF
jgi:subtilase-type serine protease